jgi:MFS family permease
VTTAVPDDGAAPAPRSGTLRAFRHRDFAVFWAGALVSNVGSWLQNLAVPYVVFEITGSAFWVGTATAAQFLPGFFASPIGGHLADTRERRTLLVVLQSLMGLAALALWAVWSSGSRSLPAILGLVAAMGLVWGMTLPSWQAFVNDLVPREDLVSAVSLNSLQFNAARSLGPAFAGLIIAALGPGWAFGLKALSFGVVVLALLAVRTRSGRPKSSGAPRLVAGFLEAVRYIPGQPGIVIVIVLVTVLGLFGTPVFGFTVVFAGSVYDVGALQLGLLNAALGVGAVLAVPLVVRSNGNGGLSRTLRLGLVVMGAAMVAFGLVPGFWGGLVCLVAVGFGFLATISGGNTAVQLIVADRLRGRVMAVRLMAYMVSVPVGALLLGWVSDQVGPRPTMVLGGGLLLATVLLLLTSRGARLLGRVDDPQDAVAPR